MKEELDLPNPKELLHKQNELEKLSNELDKLKELLKKKEIEIVKQESNLYKRTIAIENKEKHLQRLEQKIQQDLLSKNDLVKKVGELNDYRSFLIECVTNGISMMSTDISNREYYQKRLNIVNNLLLDEFEHIVHIGFDLYDLGHKCDADHHYIKCRKCSSLKSDKICDFVSNGLIITNKGKVFFKENYTSARMEGRQVKYYYKDFSINEINSNIINGLILLSRSRVRTIDGFGNIWEEPLISQTVNL
jgi:vacuolar-type H+-ATPase subunit I/STV1